MPSYVVSGFSKVLNLLKIQIDWLKFLRNARDKEVRKIDRLVQHVEVSIAERATMFCLRFVWYTIYFWKLKQSSVFRLDILRVIMNTGNLTLVVYCSNLAVQQKMSEEIGARMRAESRVVEVEKQCSMLEFDLKQSVQKMEQLMKQKERLEDEARVLRRDTREDLLGNTEFLAPPEQDWSAICPLFPIVGEEPANTGRAGAEQARAGSERAEEPHAGGGPPQVFREAAQAGDQHGAREQTLPGVSVGAANKVSSFPHNRFQADEMNRNGRMSISIINVRRKGYCGYYGQASKRLLSDGFLCWPVMLFKSRGKNCRQLCLQISTIIPT